VHRIDRPSGPEYLEGAFVDGVRHTHPLEGETTMTILDALHQGGLAFGAAGLLYTATVSATAATAVLARTPARRRAAREVLGILLRRHDTAGPGVKSVSGR
jgi:hypothetical protein